MSLKNKYTVTFIDGIDDTIINIQNVEEGQFAKEPIPRSHVQKHVLFNKWIDVSTGEEYVFDEVYKDYEVKSIYDNAYEVRFFDDFNNKIISKQLVKPGDFAISPDIPNYMTYVRVGWTEDFSKVNSDLDVHPIYIDVVKMLKTQLSHYTIANLRDIVAIQNSLYNIFTWIPGERILLPEFGSELRKLLYEGITEYNIERVMSEIRHCVSEWEPRVQIDKIVNIGTIEDTEDNTVHLKIIYTIPGLSPDKFVYDLDYNRG